MENEYVLIEGPMGNESKESFAVFWYPEEKRFEVLGAAPSSMSVKAPLERELYKKGKGFNLKSALSRGWTYYKKEFGKLTKDTENYLRQRFPASSDTGFDPRTTEAAARVAGVRSRAIRN